LSHKVFNLSFLLSQGDRKKVIMYRCFLNDFSKLKLCISDRTLRVLHNIYHGANRQSVPYFSSPIETASANDNPA